MFLDLWLSELKPDYSEAHTKNLGTVTYENGNYYLCKAMTLHAYNHSNIITMIVIIIIIIIMIIAATKNWWTTVVFLQQQGYYYTTISIKLFFIIIKGLLTKFLAISQICSQNFECK